MTITKDIKQQINRIKELAKISRQRYLDAGGDPKLSVGSLNHNDCLTDGERQELHDLLNQVTPDEDIANYIKKNGTWQERFAAFKAQMQSASPNCL